MTKIGAAPLAFLLCLLLGLSSSASSPARADQAADAKQLVAKAVAMYKEQGRAATLSAIADPRGPFRKGDIYIYVCNLEKQSVVLHPANPKLEGRDFSNLKDVKGTPFFHAMVEIAKNPGEGWVEYWWNKPGRKNPSPKFSYVKRVPGTPLFMVSGYYKD